MSETHSTAYNAGYMIGTLVGAGLGLGFFVFAIVAIVKAFTKKTTGWIVAASISALMVIGLVGAAMVAALVGIATAAKNASAADHRITSKDGLYSIEAPSSWKELPQLSAKASLAVGNLFSEQYMVVLPESKQDIKASLERYDKLVIANFSKKLQDLKVEEAKPTTVGGYPALQHRITGSVNNINIVYLYTSVELPDSFCEIQCWTLASKESTNFPVFEKVVPTFSVKKASPPAASKR